MCRVDVNLARLSPLMGLLCCLKALRCRTPHWRCHKKRRGPLKLVPNRHTSMKWLEAVSPRSSALSSGKLRLLVRSVLSLKALVKTPISYSAWPSWPSLACILWTPLFYWNFRAKIWLYGMPRKSLLKMKGTQLRSHYSVSRTYRWQAGWNSLLPGVYPLVSTPSFAWPTASPRTEEM